MSDNPFESLPPELQELLADSAKQALHPFPEIDAMNDEADYYALSTDAKAYLWEGTGDDKLFMDCAWLGVEDDALALRVWRYLFPLHNRPKTALGELINDHSTKAQLALGAGIIAAHWNERDPEFLRYVINHAHDDIPGMLLRRWIERALWLEEGHITKTEFWADVEIAIMGGWPEGEWYTSLTTMFAKVGEILKYGRDEPEKAEKILDAVAAKREAHEAGEHSLTCPGCGGHDVETVIVSSEIKKV